MNKRKKTGAGPVRKIEENSRSKGVSVCPESSRRNKMRNTIELLHLLAAATALKRCTFKIIAAVHNFDVGHRSNYCILQPGAVLIN